jgi:nicotinamidase-related amidase
LILKTELKHRTDVEDLGSRGAGLRRVVWGLEMAEPALRELVAKGRCAVLVMELQRGVVGDLACIPALATAVAEAGVITNTARLLRAARAAGVRVIHCTAAFRRDRVGSPGNVPLVNQLLLNPEHLVIGSPHVQVCPELGPEPQDLEVQRLHGMSPFTGTELDAFLRSEGVKTVIATGVSLNVGIPGLVIEAINHCYRVVVPGDCVAGWPRDYGKLVLENSIALLAAVTTADEIAKAWQ